MSDLEKINALLERLLAPRDPDPVWRGIKNKSREVIELAGDLDIAVRQKDMVRLPHIVADLEKYSSELKAAIGN